MKNSLLVFLLLSASILFAQDCISWKHYRIVTVGNSTNTELFDYQVKVQLNTSELVTAGKLRPGGPDIRVFTNTCTPLHFWSDSLGTSTTTNIWVKVPYIPASGITSFQIYYGNATAGSVVNGDSTFIFFDDFSAGTIDPNKWETVGEHVFFFIEDSILNYSSANLIPGPRFKFARTVPSFSDQVAFDFVGARRNDNGFGFSSADVALDRILFRSSAFGRDTLNQVAYMSDTTSNGFQVNGLYPYLRFEQAELNETSITARVDTANHLELSRFANESLGTANTDIYNFAEAEMPGFHFILSTFGPNPTIQLANIRVRQVIDTIPDIMVGPELIPTVSSVSTLIDPARVKVFPNPTTQHTWVQVDLDEPVQLTVTDVIGRQLGLKQVSLAPRENHRIDLQSLPIGIYFMRFYRQSDGALLHTRKLSVIR